MTISPLNTALVDHKLAYGVDVLQLHWSWAAHWLYAGDRRQAHEAYQRARKAAEGVIRQFDAIGDSLAQIDVTGRDAEEWRANRDSSRKIARKSS